jgi:hypothetical protein
VTIAFEAGLVGLVFLAPLTARASGATSAQDGTCAKAGAAVLGPLPVIPPPPAAAKPPEPSGK